MEGVEWAVCGGVRWRLHSSSPLAIQAVFTVLDVMSHSRLNTQ